MNCVEKFCSKASFGIVNLNKPMEFFILKRTKQVQKIENVKTSGLADICRFINLYICTFILALRNLIYTAADAPEVCFKMLKLVIQFYEFNLNYACPVK